MTFGSVCSGIEAASVAWHPLGWKTGWVSEIEDYPCAVLERHYPKTPNLGDMTRITQEDLDRHGSIDLLVGGTPCQSFSVAGLRRGLDDPRGNLALRFLQLAGAARPRWLVWENVPGVLSSWSDEAVDLAADEPGAEVVWQSHDFATFLSGLRELGYGYVGRVLDAQHFGVPQRRRRIFVVGYLGDWRPAAAVLLERHCLSGNPPPSRKTGTRVTGTLTARSRSGGGLGGDFERDGGLVPEVARTLMAKGNSSFDDSMETYVAHTLRAEGFDASEDGTGRGTPLVPVMPFDTTQITHPENRSRCEPGSPCHALPESGHALAIAFHGSQDPDVSGDVTHPLARNYGQEASALIDAHVRRLTPRECERLQGFPDDYTLIPYRGKPAADGPRYKALGNSMAVPVMRWIGQRIAIVDAIARGAT